MHSDVIIELTKAIRPLISCKAAADREPAIKKFTGRTK